MNQKLIRILEEGRTGKRLNVKQIEVDLLDYPQGSLAYMTDDCLTPPGQMLVVVPDVFIAHKFAYALWENGVSAAPLCRVDGDIDDPTLGHFIFNYFQALVADRRSLELLPSFINVNSIHVFEPDRISEDSFVNMIDGLTTSLQRKFPDTLYVQYQAGEN